VRILRAAQFPEDGPLAHPIRPDSYQEISNFYTATVYNKGAEVIRMMTVLAGPNASARAPTSISSVMTAGGDLRGFRQGDRGRRGSRPCPVPPLVRAGRNPIAVTLTHAGETTTTLRQTVPPTPGQPDKQPMVIPAAHRAVRPRERRHAANT
jgi:aminopeptidase N